MPQDCEHYSEFGCWEYSELENFKSKSRTLESEDAECFSKMLKSEMLSSRFCDWLLEVLPGSFLGPVAMIRLWTFSLFYLMAELWGSVVLSLLFWSFANQVQEDCFTVGTCARGDCQR